MLDLNVVPCVTFMIRVDLDNSINNAATEKNADAAHGQGEHRENDSRCSSCSLDGFVIELRKVSVGVNKLVVHLFASGLPVEFLPVATVLRSLVITVSLALLTEMALVPLIEFRAL